MRLWRFPHKYIELLGCTKISFSMKFTRGMVFLSRLLFITDLYNWTAGKLLILMLGNILGVRGLQLHACFQCNKFLLCKQASKMCHWAEVGIFTRQIMFVVLSFNTCDIYFACESMCGELRLIYTLSYQLNMLSIHTFLSRIL